jgi:drug/metabolite transporter (DMT)-like permease
VDRNRRFGLIMAASTSLLWGFLAIALKVALEWVPPVTIVWFRFAVAFAVLAAIFAFRAPERLRILRRPPALGVLAAIALTGNYVAYLQGVHLTTPSNAQVLIQVAPLLFAGLGIVIFHEHLSRRQLLWSLVAVAGMTLFFRDQLAGLVGDAERADDHLRGNTFILMAAVSWASYAAFQKTVVARGVSPQSLNLVLYLFPVFALLPWVEWDAFHGLSTGQWTLMAFLAANTLLAYGALGEALKYLPAAEVSLIIVLNPIITLVTMALLTTLEVSWIEPDTVSPVGYAAALVLLVGVLGVLRRPSRAVSRRPAARR